MESKLRIVYMGTPDFAVYPLEKLVEQNFNIVSVITNIDKPAGRGKKLQESPVKVCAQKHNLPILQPKNLKDKDFISSLKDLQADLFIVVAFRMLPKVVWEIPTHGTFNLHSSLLPQYRGAAPINWAVVNGETKSGVTTFFINENIDTGNVLLQKETPISETETAGELHDKLMVLGAKTIIETIKGIENNTLTAIPQEKIQAGILKDAPKINKETCKINWAKNAESIYNHIRGFSPFPAAWTRITKDEKPLAFKIFHSEYKIEEHDFAMGTIIQEKNQIKIYCANGYIIPTQVQLEGKKRMSLQDCIRGFSFENYSIQ